MAKPGLRGMTRPLPSRPDSEMMLNPASFRMYGGPSAGPTNEAPPQTIEQHVPPGDGATTGQIRAKRGSRCDPLRGASLGGTGHVKVPLRRFATLTPSAWVIVLP